MIEILLNQKDISVLRNCLKYMLSQKHLIFKTFLYKNEFEEILSKYCNNKVNSLKALLAHYLKYKALKKCKICNNTAVYFCKGVLSDCCSHKCSKINSKSTFRKTWQKKSKIDKNKSKEKRKQTCLKKYGTQYSFQSEKVKESIKLSNLKKHGDCNYRNVEKAKKTRVQKYGYEHSLQSPDILKKSKQTCLKKYGTLSYTNPEKAKQTRLKKYGYEHLFQSPEILAKFKQSMLEKYGYENAGQVPEFHEKSQSKFASYTKKHFYSLNNKTYHVQGYEPQCLDYLLNVEKIDPQDICLLKSEGKPSISYFNTLKNRKAIYHPDIYIKSQNRIIEVKSEYTYRIEPLEISDKIKGCLDLGYSVSVYVMLPSGSVFKEIRLDKDEANTYEELCK